MSFIGISCYYHDSSAALITEEGEILAAVEEERFTRKKHDNSFPFHAINYCLDIANNKKDFVTAYIYYEKPIRLFMRIVETCIKSSPRGFTFFHASMKEWLTKKLFISNDLKNNLSLLDDNFIKKNLFYSSHHTSHASSAFYPSKFKEAAILCIDGVGEWSTSSAWIGKENKITNIWEINFPHSIGLLYASFTFYCGFKINSGEYKLMGLAPYGRPLYYEKILSNLIDLKEDGSFKLNMKYFKYHRSLKMISNNFYNLFGKKERKKEEKIDQFHMDIAASIQKVIETILIKIANNLYEITKKKNLCLSGGVALNCVANRKLLNETKFENIWVQPASGDSGSSLGAAFSYLYLKMNKKRIIKKDDSMKSGYLGPEFSDNQIINFLEKNSIRYEKFDYFDLNKIIANEISKGKIIGWFQGRMEFGPRALGNRSIIADPRNPKMKEILNSRIKARESFRPFAPAVLDEYKIDLFNLNEECPYMLITVDKINLETEKLIPSVVHVDQSARVQTVKKERNQKFYNLIEAFKKITDCPVLINTSFNVRGEPIVCTPEDAFKCFLYADLDYLVLNSFLISKEKCSINLLKNFINYNFIED